jgi:hypothetical protein
MAPFVRADLRLLSLFCGPKERKSNSSAMEEEGSSQTNGRRKGATRRRQTDPAEAD